MEVDIWILLSCWEAPRSSTIPGKDDRLTGETSGLLHCTRARLRSRGAQPSVGVHCYAARSSRSGQRDGWTDGGICTSTNLINTGARADGDARTHALPRCFCRTTLQKTSCRNLPEPSWTPPRQSGGAPPLHLSSSPPHLLSSSSLHLIILTPSTHLSILVLSFPPYPSCTKGPASVAGGGASGKK